MLREYTVMNTQGHTLAYIRKCHRIKAYVHICDGMVTVQTGLSACCADRENRIQSSLLWYLLTT